MNDSKVVPITVKEVPLELRVFYASLAQQKTLEKGEVVTMNELYLEALKAYRANNSRS